MKFAVLIVALLSFPSVAASQKLCRTGEIDYFSCETVTGKSVSVCGNIADGEISGDSWLQYRFGKIGAIELTYPTEKQGSVKKFEGNYFNRYGVVDLRFISERTLYGVELSETYSGDDAQPRSQPSGDVTVIVGKTKHVSMDSRRSTLRSTLTSIADLTFHSEVTTEKPTFFFTFTIMWRGSSVMANPSFKRTDLRPAA